MLKRGFSFSYPCPRRMRDIVKMSLIERETSDKIREIWNTYHSARPDNVSCVLNTHQYSLLHKRTKESQFFIFPVFRKGGHFLMVSQAQDKSNLFTYLEDFKQSTVSAEPYFVLTLFDEIMRNKGVVPVRGDIINYKISKTEAEILMNAFLAHYIEMGLYEDKVKIFNHDPNAFKHDAYIKEYSERFSPSRPVGQNLEQKIDI